MHPILIYIISAVLNFIIGSFPTSYIIVRIMKGIDIREHGSRNPGATNTYRVAGAKAGIITLIGDIFKGVVAVAVVKYIHNNISNIPIHVQYILMITAVLGHTFSVFLKFKGGKGVATGAGVFLGLAPYAFSLTLLLFIIVVYVTRFISLGSIIAALVLPVFIYFFEAGPQKEQIMYFAAAVSLLIIMRHKKNIVRLLQGKENKFGSQEKRS